MSRLLLLLAGACVLAFCAQHAAAQEGSGFDEVGTEVSAEIVPQEEEEPVISDRANTSVEDIAEDSTAEESESEDTEQESRNVAVARTAGSKQRALARTVAHAKARTAGKARTAANARTAGKKVGRAGAKSARAHHQ